MGHAEEVHQYHIALVKAAKGRQLLARFVRYAEKERSAPDGSDRLDRLAAGVNDYLIRTADPKDILR